jgi:hypothetical protein
VGVRFIELREVLVGVAVELNDVAEVVEERGRDLGDEVGLHRGATASCGWGTLIPPVSPTL